MFLRPLKAEQKVLFLGLAERAALANKITEEPERQLLAAFADEMGIAPADRSGLELDALCKELKELSSLKELHQMTFEIVGMLLSDSSFDADEQAFLSTIAVAFGISAETIAEMKQCVDDYMILIRRINKLMFS